MLKTNCEQNSITAVTVQQQLLKGLKTLMLSSKATFHTANGRKYGLQQLHKGPQNAVPLQCPLVYEEKQKARFTKDQGCMRAGLR